MLPPSPPLPVDPEFPDPACELALASELWLPDDGWVLDA